MLHLDDLQAFLDAVADAPRREGPPGFIDRCNTIDLLEMYLGEFSSASSAEPARSAVGLRDRALALCRELEDLNTGVVEKLRHDIETGRRLRGDLMSELERYRTDSVERDARGNLEYDSLDVLVSGILGTDRLLDPGPLEALPDMVPYQPTPVRVILELVRRARLNPRDVLVDLGSGLGIVPTLASLLSGCTSIGIEVQPAYCLHAEECVRRLNRAHVRFLCQDVRSADFSVGTVFYMYTPFRGAMLREVLRRLHEAGRRRPIRLCTHGPMVSEAAEQALTSFERMPGTPGPVSIFHSRPD